jgi:WD40 repeat protein
MAIVFLSHSSDDNEVADQIRAGLIVEGYESVFLDFASIRAGTRWRDELSRYLRTADAVVFLGSSHSERSVWCTAELAVAKTLEKVILPVQLDASARHELLSDEQWIVSPTSVEDALRHLSSELEHRFDQAAHRRSWDPNRSPYPGLRPFSAEDGGVFFGRDAAIDELVRLTDPVSLLDHSALVAVVGASGTGKSSLVRAGLLPSLRANHREPWKIIPPIVPGREPFRELARAFLDAGAGREIVEGLQRRDASLADVVSELEAVAGAPRKTLIVLDQAEELCDADQRADFLTMLAEGAREGRRCRVVLTVREGWLDRLFRGVEVEGRIVSMPLVPLTRGALAAVIEGPAHRADITLESGFVPQVLDDAGTGAALPLLALALERTYRAMPEGARLLTWDQYQAVGGVANAVAQQANEAIAFLGPDAEASAVRLLVQFARIDEDGTWSRRARDVDGLDEDEREVLRAFEAARLVIVEAHDRNHVRATVVHAALFSAWPPLARALERELEDLRFRSRLDRAASDWAEADRPAADLPTGPRFRPLAGWLARRPDEDLDETTQAYVAAARRAERKRLLRRGLLIGCLAGLALLAAGFGVAQLQERARAGEAAQLAEGRGLVGRARTERRMDIALALGVSALAKGGDEEALDALIGTEARQPFFRGYLGPPTGIAGRSATWTASSGLVVANAGGDVSLWNKDGTPAGGFAVPGRPLIRSVAESPDEQWIAAGDDHGHVFVHRGDATNELTRDEAPAHGGRVGQLVAIDPLHLLSAGGDGDVALWNLSDGQPAWRAPIGIPLWSAAVLAGDSTVIAGTDDGQVIALAVSDGHELGRARVSTSIIRSMAVAGDHVYVGDNQGAVSVVTRSPAEGVIDDAQAIFAGQSPVWAMATTNDGAVLTGWTDGAVRLVDSKGIILDTYQAHAGPIRSIAYDSRTGWFAVTGDDSLVSRWSSAGDSLLVDQRVSSGEDLVGAADGDDHVYVGGTDGRISRLDPSGEVLEPVGQPMGGVIDDIEASSDGSIIAVGLLNGDALAISTATGQTLRRLSTGGEAAHVALTDQELIAAGQHVWRVDVRSGEQRELTKPDGVTITALDASADGDSIVAAGGGGDRGAAVVGWENGETAPRAAYFGPAGLVVNALDLDAAHRRLVLGRNDGRLDIWALDPLAETGIAFTQHTREIYDVHFAKSGTKVFSLDGAGKIWTWTAEFGTSTASALSSELGRARSLLPTDDGSAVAVVGQGGVTEARLDAARVRQLACELAGAGC